MKKTFAIVLMALSLLLVLSACVKYEDTTSTTKTTDSVSDNTAKDQQTADNSVDDTAGEAGDDTSAENVPVTDEVVDEEINSVIVDDEDIDIGSLY